MSASVSVDIHCNGYFSSKEDPVEFTLERLYGDDYSELRNTMTLKVGYEATLYLNPAQVRELAKLFTDVAETLPEPEEKTDE